MWISKKIGTEQKANYEKNQTNQTKKKKKKKKNRPSKKTKMTKQNSQLLIGKVNRGS